MLGLFPDKYVGKGRIVDHAGNFILVYVYDAVGLSAQGKTHKLIQEEVLTEDSIGTEGKLVLRQSGMLISYHLIPN